MTTFNRLDYTKRAIESLLETAGDDFHLVVVDNNSDDGSNISPAGETRSIRYFGDFLNWGSLAF